MRKLRVEEEVIANWKGDIEKPVVSICCLAFNHEFYIEDALEGFLIQETDFPFEILIHDDASTDRTADIIREYEERYPRIVKPIYQAENQYSKGVKVSSVFNFPRAQGKYIAMCEGDDYWVDKNKLKKQIKRIEELNTDICFTNAYLENNSGGRVLKYKSGEILDKLIFSEVIRKGGGGMPTPSLLIRKEVLMNLPSWFSKAPVGDFFIQILGAQRNGAAYVSDITSVYRVASVGSWTSKRSKASEVKIKEEAEAYEFIFNEMRTDILRPDDLNYALAVELYRLAALSIKMKYFELANDLIARSWRYYKLQSIKQIILVYTRFFWRSF